MKRVLIIEDDPFLRETLVDVLDALDYEARSAETGDEALELARASRYDLVIADIRMPGKLDGLGALEALKQRQPDMACIVMTGYADDSAPPRALRIRVDDYLYKPFHIENVVDALERVKTARERNRAHQVMVGRLLNQVAPEQALLDLQQERESCMKSYFIVVRSNGLTPEPALAAWDALEALELDYLKILRVPQLKPEQARPLRERYVAWRESLSQPPNGSPLATAPRASNQVDTLRFWRFWDRVKSGKVGAEDLALAICLRLIPPDRLRHSGQESLWQQYWG